MKYLGTKILDQVELRGQELLTLIIKEWAKTVNPRIGVTFTLMEVSNHKQHVRTFLDGRKQYARCLRYKGKVMVLNQEVRFDCSFFKSQLTSLDVKFTCVRTPDRPLITFTFDKEAGTIETVDLEKDQETGEWKVLKIRHSWISELEANLKKNFW